MLNLVEKEPTYIFLLTFVSVRDAVSLFSRLDISNNEIRDLSEHCSNYFRASALFFKVNLTVWTVGFIVPAHTQHMKDTIALVLALTQWKAERPSMCLLLSIARIQITITGRSRSFNMNLSLLYG